MAYEPQTEVGKQAIAEGADPAVIEAQEAAGELTDEGAKPEHVEKPGEGESPAAAEEPAPGEEPAEPGAGDEPPLERTPQHMPIWKHKEELKQLEAKLREENASQIEQAVASAIAKQGGATSEDVSKLADEFGMSPEAAQAFMERMTSTLEKRLGIDDLKKDAETRKQTEKELAEERGFRDELASATTRDALKAAAGDKPITAEVEAKLKELAYTTTYSKYRLADIVKLEGTSLFPSAPAESRSAERGRGGAGRAAPAARSLDDVTPDQIESMTPEEFKQFSDGLGQGSRFTRTVTPGKGSS